MIDTYNKLKNLLYEINLKPKTDIFYVYDSQKSNFMLNWLYYYFFLHHDGCTYVPPITTPLHKELSNEP